MHQDIGSYAAKALDQGLLINVTQGNIIRMLPPLTMSDAEADELVSRVVALINA
jgi:acetylornithine aminotransferase